MHNLIMDAQAALGFVVSQTSHIETQVAEVQYPDIQYANLIPVDTSANEWAKSVTYFSTNKVGAAGWFHAKSKDIHVADVERAKAETTVEMADIGYRWDLEEIGQAALANVNLSADRAVAARRAYEEFVDGVAIRGDDIKNFEGLINNSTVGVTQAELVSGSTDWRDKTADDILKDVNDALSGIYVDSLQIEMADTVLLPVTLLAFIATKRLNDLSSTTVLQWLIQNNVYTFTTGRALTVRGVRGLETAGTDTGSGATGRMIAYRRDPQVLKMHIPMTHRFLPPFQSAPLVFDVPGIFRLGGLEIRRPGAVRYVDGVMNPAYE